MTASLASVIGVVIGFIVVLSWTRHCINKRKVTARRTLLHKRKTVLPHNPSSEEPDVEGFVDLESIGDPPGCYRGQSKDKSAALLHEARFDESLRLCTMSGLDSPIRPVELPPMPRIPRCAGTGMGVDDMPGVSEGNLIAIPSKAHTDCRGRGGE